MGSTMQPANWSASRQLVNHSDSQLASRTAKCVNLVQVAFVSVQPGASDASEPAKQARRVSTMGVVCSQQAGGALRGARRGKGKV